MEKLPKVLLVEDEALVALTVVDLLEEMGCSVLGPANSVRAALNFLEVERPDCALLDCNLGNEFVWPVAQRLQGMGVSFMFGTGYGVKGIDQRFAHAPVLPKPYEFQRLSARLQALLAPKP